MNSKAVTGIAGAIVVASLACVLGIFVWRGHFIAARRQNQDHDDGKATRKRVNHRTGFVVDEHYDRIIVIPGSWTTVSGDQEDPTEDPTDDPTQEPKEEESVRIIEQTTEQNDSGSVEFFI